MIPFMEKTWLLWWMFAVVVIVRWFHALQTTQELKRGDEPGSTPQHAHANSVEFSSPKTESLLV
jgi:hypothetical protein